MFTVRTVPVNTFFLPVSTLDFSTRLLILFAAAVSPWLNGANWLPCQKKLGAHSSRPSGFPDRLSRRIETGRGGRMAASQDEAGGST